MNFDFPELLPQNCHLRSQNPGRLMFELADGETTVGQQATAGASVHFY